MKITLRPATRADLPRIGEIRGAVRENRLSDPSAVSDNEVYWYLDHAIFLIVETEGTVQAFGCANPLTGLVWALFVDPSSEGRGLGKAMLAEMVRQLTLAGRTQAHLTTGEGTRAAVFYQKQGWRISGRALSGELVFVLPLGTTRT